MLCVLTKNVQSCYCGIKKINSNALTIRSVSENLIKDGCYRALINRNGVKYFLVNSKTGVLRLLISIEFPFQI